MIDYDELKAVTSLLDYFDVLESPIKVCKRFLKSIFSL